jgi:hypothetical protein
MKLHGNIMNRIAETGTQTDTPAVGEGCTIYSYSDRAAGTVVRIATPKKVFIKYDKTTRIDTNGMSESQTYSYETNDAGLEIEVSLRRDGIWHEGTTQKGRVVRFGHRDTYHDFSF